MPLRRIITSNSAGGGYTVQKYARFYHYDAGGDILQETDEAGNIIHSFAYDLSGHPVAFTQPTFPTPHHVSPRNF